MQCEEFEGRLNRILDERGVPEADEALMEHARKCQLCARRCSALLRALTLLSAQPLPQPRTGLADRVLAELHQPRVFAWQRVWGQARRVHVGALLGAAAALVVAAVWLIAAGDRQRPTASRVSQQPHASQRTMRSTDAAGQNRSSGQPRQAPQPDDAQAPGAAETGVEPAVDASPLPQLARQATDTYLHLAADTRQSLQTALLALPNLTPSAGEPMTHTQGPDLLVQAGTLATGWVKPVAAPIQRSASQALRSLMLVVPMPPEDPAQ